MKIDLNDSFLIMRSLIQIEVVEIVCIHVVRETQWLGYLLLDILVCVIICFSYMIHSLMICGWIWIHIILKTKI